MSNTSAAPLLDTTASNECLRERLLRFRTALNSLRSTEEPADECRIEHPTSRAAMYALIYKYTNGFVARSVKLAELRDTPKSPERDAHEEFLQEQHAKANALRTFLLYNFDARLQYSDINTESFVLDIEKIWANVYQSGRV